MTTHTTVVTAALSPKLPPFVGDAPGAPTRRPVRSGLLLATTAIFAAFEVKLPPFRGD